VSKIPGHFKKLLPLNNAISDELIKMTAKSTNGTKFLLFQSYNFYKQKSIFFSVYAVTLNALINNVYIR